MLGTNSVINNTSIGTCCYSHNDPRFTGGLMDFFQVINEIY
jgi:hypothetical protein